LYSTVVWEKFVVENIHRKIIRCKFFLSLLISDEDFYGEFFYHGIFCSSSWLPFHQFHLDKKLLHIKMEFYERNSCVCVTIATRDAVTGEEQLKSLNAKGNIMPYVVAVKKAGIIVGDLPQKYLELVE